MRCQIKLNKDFKPISMSTIISINKKKPKITGKAKRECLIKWVSLIKIINPSVTSNKCENNFQSTKTLESFHSSTKSTLKSKAPECNLKITMFRTEIIVRNFKQSPQK